MSLPAYRLGDALRPLVSAGKMAPKNPDVYRWLGEVLLRRGDAERAAKVLERAVVLGKIDSGTVFWRNQADGFIELQKRGGGQAVLAALAVELEKQGLRPLRPSNRPPKAAAPKPEARSEQVSDSDVTVVRKGPSAMLEEEALRPAASPPA